MGGTWGGGRAWKDYGGSGRSRGGVNKVGEWAGLGKTSGRAGEWAGLVRKVGPGRGGLTLLRVKVTLELVGFPPAPAVSAPGIPERG